MDAEQLVAALPDGVAPPVRTEFPDRTTEWSLTPLDHPPSRRARSAGAGSRRDHHGVALPRATGAPRFAGPSSTMGAAPSDVRHQQLRRARSESGSPDLVQQVQRRVHQRPGHRVAHDRRAVSRAMPPQRPWSLPHQKKERRPASAAAIIASRDTTQAQAMVQSAKHERKLSRGRRRPRTHWVASAPWNPTKLHKEYSDLTCKDRVGWSALPDAGDTRIRELGKREATQRAKAHTLRRHVQLAAAAQRRAERCKRRALALEAKTTAAQRAQMGFETESRPGECHGTSSTSVGTGANTAVGAFAASAFLDAATTATHEGSNPNTAHGADEQVTPVPSSSEAHTRENDAEADFLWRRETEALTEAASWLRRADKPRAAAELRAKALQSEGHRLVLRAAHALDGGDMMLFVQLAQRSYDALLQFASSRPAARILAHARFIEKQRDGGGAAAAALVHAAETEAELVEMLALVVGVHHGVNAHNNNGARPAGILAAAFALHRASQYLTQSWVRLSAGTIKSAVEAHRRAYSLLEWLEQWSLAWNECGIPSTRGSQRLSHLIGETSAASIAAEAKMLRQHALDLGQRLREVEEQHHAASVLQKVYRGVVARRQLEIMIVPMIVVAVRDTKIGDDGASGAAALERLCAVLTKYCAPAEHAQSDGQALDSESGGGHAASAPLVLEALHQAHAVGVTMGSLTDNSTSPLYVNAALQFLAQALDASNSGSSSAATGNFRVQLLTERLCARAIQGSEMVVISCLLNTVPEGLESTQVAARSASTIAVQMDEMKDIIASDAQHSGSLWQQCMPPQKHRVKPTAAQARSILRGASATLAQLLTTCENRGRAGNELGIAAPEQLQALAQHMHAIGGEEVARRTVLSEACCTDDDELATGALANAGLIVTHIFRGSEWLVEKWKKDSDAVYAVRTGLANAPNLLVLSPTAVMVAVELAESVIAHSERWGGTMAELGLQIASAAAETATMTPAKFKANTQVATNLHQRLGKFTAFLTSALDLLLALRVRLDKLGVCSQHWDGDLLKMSSTCMVRSSAAAASVLFSSSVDDASIAINAVLKASASSADLALVIEQALRGLNQICSPSPVPTPLSEDADANSIAPVLAASLRRQFAGLASHASSCSDIVGASASNLMRQMFGTPALLPPIFITVPCASDNDAGQFEIPTPTSIDAWHQILQRSCQRLAEMPDISSSSAGRVSLANASEAVRGFWHVMFVRSCTKSNCTAATFQRLTSGLQAYAAGLVTVSTSNVISSGFTTSTSSVKAKQAIPVTLNFFMTALSFVSDFATSISASLAEHGPRPQQSLEPRAAALCTLHWLLPQFTMAAMRILIATPRRAAGRVHNARLKVALESSWRAQLRLTCLNSLAESLSPLPTIADEKSHKKAAAQVWHRVLQSCAKTIIKENGLDVLTQTIARRDLSHVSEQNGGTDDEIHRDETESKDGTPDALQEAHANESTASRAAIMNAGYAERKCITQCRTAAARVLTAVVSAELEPISGASGTSRHTGRELDVIQSLRETGYAQIFNQILQREQLDSELVVHAMLCSRLPYELVGHHMRRGVDVKGELEPLLKSAAFLGIAATCALARFPSEIAVQVAGARMLLSLLRFCAPATQIQATPEAVSEAVDTQSIMSEFTGTLLSDSSHAGKNIMVALLGAHRALHDPSILADGGVETFKGETSALTQLDQSLSSAKWADDESNDSSTKLISAAEFRASRRRTSYMAFNSGMALESARVAAKVKAIPKASSRPHGFDEDRDCTAASCALLMLVHHNDTAISIMRNAPVRDTGNAVLSGGLEATADVLECVLGSASQGDVADHCLFADRLADAGAINILAAVLNRCAATFESRSVSAMQSLLCACNALYGLASVSEHQCIKVARHKTTTTGDSIGLLAEVHKRAAKYESQVNNSSCTPLSTSSSLPVRIAVAAMAALRKMAQQFASTGVSLHDREWWAERVTACGAADSACGAIKAFPHEIGHAAQAAGLLVELAAPKVVTPEIPAMLRLISPLTIDTLYSAITFAAEAHVGTAKTQNGFDQRLFKELARRQKALISRCGGTQNNAQSIADDLHLSARTLLAALTGWVEPIGDATRSADLTVEAAMALETFINRDGLRTITKIIRMTYRCINDVAEPIVVDCIATCTASVPAINGLPGATKLTDADVLAVILEAGVIAAVRKHVVGRCVRQIRQQDVSAGPAVAMAQPQVCDATLSLFGRLLDTDQNVEQGRRLCEDIHAVLAHVLDQLADGPLTAGDQLLQRRAETLQARLESIV